jgi:hypothetical protein
MNRDELERKLDADRQKTVMESILKEWAYNLVPGGRAYMVLNHGKHISLIFVGKSGGYGSLRDGCVVIDDPVAAFEWLPPLIGGKVLPLYECHYGGNYHGLLTVQGIAREQGRIRSQQEVHPMEITVSHRVTDNHFGRYGHSLDDAKVSWWQESPFVRSKDGLPLPLHVQIETSAYALGIKLTGNGKLARLAPLDGWQMLRYSSGSHIGGDSVGGYAHYFRYLEDAAE